MFGEKFLLNFIKGWFCDVKEDFFMFGRCLYDCWNIILNFIELGCSIGIMLDFFVGFVGFFYELKYLDNLFGFGFFMVLYVVIK